MDDMDGPRRIFLLSPARFGGPRSAMLLRESADFEVARRLRAGAATIGEVYSFISGLYFRGKLAYANAFGSALVIAPGRGLLAPDSVVSIGDLRDIGSISVDAKNRAFREPLLAAALEFVEQVHPGSPFVLLGSVATDKYTTPLLHGMGARLLFPEEFRGRGDMSRGALMLRSASAGNELSYVRVASMVRAR